MSKIKPKRPLNWHPIVEEIADTINPTLDDVYIVGGTVRDALMGRPIHDLDLTTAADGRPIAKRIANSFKGAFYPLDDSRGVGRAIIEYEGNTWTVDVAKFRGKTLEQDLRDRDFTVNAIAVDLDDLEHIIDPLDGLGAIERRIIRLCSPESIALDPVRALRAIRFSLNLKMRITPETVAAVKRDGADLNFSSPERIRDEFFKLLNTPNVTTGIQTLEMLGLLKLILPETVSLKGVTQSPPHTLDVWRHTLSVIDFMERLLMVVSPQRHDEAAANFALGMVAFSLPHLREQLHTHTSKVFPNERTYKALMMLGALAHDIGKPATRSVDDDGRIRFFEHETQGATIAAQWGKRLKLSNEETERLTKIVQHHMRPHHLYWAKKVTKRAYYRYWRELDEMGVDVALLGIADTLGTYGANFKQDEWIKYVELIRSLLENYYLQGHELVHFTPLITGDVLIKDFNMPPGPRIGKLLDAVHEAQAVGEISTLEQARAWVEAWLAENP